MRMLAPENGDPSVNESVSNSVVLPPSSAVGMLTFFQPKTSYAANRLGLSRIFVSIPVCKSVSGKPDAP